MAGLRHLRQILYGGTVAVALALQPAHSRLEVVAQEEHNHTREFYESFKTLEGLKVEAEGHETALGYACLAGWYGNARDVGNQGKYVKKALELDPLISMGNQYMAAYLMRSQGKKADLDLVDTYAQKALEHAEHPRDKVRCYGLMAIIASKRKDYGLCRFFTDKGLAIDPKDETLLYFKSQLPP